MTEILSMYTIYDCPSDFPRSIVVRRWEVRTGHRMPVPMESHPYNSLMEARAAIPKGLRHLPRDPKDDRTILETWF